MNDALFVQIKLINFLSLWSSNVKYWFRVLLICYLDAVALDFYHRRKENLQTLLVYPRTVYFIVESVVSIQHHLMDTDISSVSLPVP